MHRYKTVVTDYEGMQGVLDAHAEHGWRLFSVTPDTWRKVAASDHGMEPPQFANLDAKPIHEYSASYYLLVFARDGYGDDAEHMSSLLEAFPVSQSHEYGD
mgnify:CR=1 FL=1